jgi:hypothetical protein
MRPIRRRSFTAIETSIFLGSASLMLAPHFEVRLGAPGEERGPRALEGQTRLMKRCDNPVAALARPAAGIEPAAPSPFRSSAETAHAFRDRADVHVAVVDAPGLLAGVRVAAVKAGAIMPRSSR